MTAPPAGRLAPRGDAIHRTAGASGESGYRRDVLAGRDQGEPAGDRGPAGTS